MKYYCLLFCIMEIAAPKETAVTLTVRERVNMLKRQIADQIREKQLSPDFIQPVNSEFEEVSYVDIESKPITPIMDFDERKKKDKFKLREIVTKPTMVTIPVTPEETGIEKEPGRSFLQQRSVKKRRNRNKHRIAAPLDSFYRRLLSDESKPLKWIHCQDLITPFFNGYKTDITVAKRLTIEDNSVIRLLQLLSYNTTGHTKEEIYSILYQISNIQIRMFQWDVSAMMSLINVIIKDVRPHTHTFVNLIRGVRNLLSSWHLDFANTTNLLKQARIFRPPCVRVSDYEGSTKTSKSIRYQKSTNPKPTCAVTDPTCKKNDYDDDVHRHV